MADEVGSENGQQLYRSLLKDYEEALYQLAEARLHIDRLRFGGAHVNIHKHFILTHSVDRRRREDAAVDETDGSFTIRDDDYKESITTGDQFALKRAGTVEQIAELQHRLQALHERTEFSEISLDEVQSELMDIHQMHQKLAADLAVMMDAADNETCTDPESMKLKHELMVLAQQLQDFIALLQDKEETILNTTMRRRSSSNTNNPHHQQTTNKVEDTDIVEDIQQHCNNEQFEREGWKTQKEKCQRNETTTPAAVGEGLLTPPYTPLTKDPAHTTVEKGGHHSNVKPSTNRASKIPIYSGARLQPNRHPTCCCHSDDTACSSVLDNPQRESKKPSTIEETSQHINKHPFNKQQRDELHNRNGEDIMKVNNLIEYGKGGRSITPPTIVIDSSPPLPPPPPSSTHHQTDSHMYTPPYYHIWQRGSDQIKRVDKSVTATPKMTDKGIQVDTSLVVPPSPPAAVAKRRRKKKHQKRKPKEFDSLLSSDESFVTLIEPSKDFFKSLPPPPNHHTLIKRRNRTGSYKGKENPGTPRRSDIDHHYYCSGIRKERRKSSSNRKKKPTSHHKVTEYNKPFIYHDKSSLESIKDTLSSSSSDSQSTILNSRYKFCDGNHERNQPKTSHLFHTTTSLCNDCRRPHSDTSIIPMLHSSRPILRSTTSSRPIPIPRVSRPIPIPCRHHHQKEQRKGSLNLDEAIGLAEKLKNSSKRMNSALLYDTYDLPRYSV